MQKKILFRVAEHTFSLLMPEKDIKGDMLSAYLPFEVSEESVQDIVYSVNVVDSMDYEVTRPLLVDTELSDEDMVRVNVYETKTGLLYNIIMPQSEEINAQLHITDNTATLMFNTEDENLFHWTTSFNNAMILSYMSFTIAHDTLLLHASTIIKEGKSYLFLGKSGTGKSTHSRMWLETFSDAELLNDDHPVVRYFEDRGVIAYGSPWSGKTRCYRNLSAPVGGVIRIKRAGYNKLNRLSKIGGYASIMTSCSGVQWSKKLADAKAKSLESIIANISCYDMECLPNNEAANVCFNSLKGYE